jgi:chromosome segregation ATPase
VNVESIKTELVKIIGNVTYVHAIIENVSDRLNKSELEIEKLNSIIDELRDENERLKREAKGGEA